MDTRIRALERAASQREPEVVVAWIRARRRAGEVAAVRPATVDWVRGPALAALLRGALAGRREFHVLRSRGLEEGRAGRLVGALRALERGEPRPWTSALAWAAALQLDPEDLALAAELLRYGDAHAKRHPGWPLSPAPERTGSESNLESPFDFDDRDVP